jgi:hypothetical protein
MAKNKLKDRIKKRLKAIKKKKPSSGNHINIRLGDYTKSTSSTPQAVSHTPKFIHVQPQPQPHVIPNIQAPISTPIQFNPPTQQPQRDFTTATPLIKQQQQHNLPRYLEADSDSEYFSRLQARKPLQPTSSPLEAAPEEQTWKPSIRVEEEEEGGKAKRSYTRRTQAQKEEYEDQLLARARRREERSAKKRSKPKVTHEEEEDEEDNN